MSRNGIMESCISSSPSCRRMRRVLVGALLSSLSLCVVNGSAGTLRAQGPTSAAIAGRVLDERGNGVPGADVIVRNDATGIAMHATSRDGGRYRVGGLDVGGPYSVTVRRLGSSMLTRTGLYLSLGQQRQVDVAL